MRPRTPIKIYLKAIASLLFFSIFVEDCAFCDFQKELESNKQLGVASQQAKEKVKAQIKEGTLSKLQLLRRRLLCSFGIIFSAITLGIFCITVLTKTTLKDMVAPRHIFVLLSMVSFSWATLGRLGWQGQTAKGDTVFEDLDELIFRCLYWLGALFGMLAVALQINATTR